MEGLFNVIKDLQGVIQRGLTNFKKSPKDRLTIEYVETKQDLLEKDWNLFKDNYIKIHELHKVQDSSKLTDMYESTEETYIMYKCLIKTMLNKFGNAKVSANDGHASKSTFVKLPKISIPNFSGKYSEWTTFRDLFVSLVHNNNHLDNIQKLHYLKSHLCGEAEQLVRHTPITDSNYMQCWSLLAKRYNNKKYLVNCILKRLFTQKLMQVESAHSLKELVDTTNDCLSALSNLDINVSTWDVIVIHILTFKLDAETRKQWELIVYTENSNDLPTFKQFCSFLENRFRALECIEPTKRVLAQQVSSSHGPKTLVGVSSTTTHNIRCEFCSEQHKLCFCKRFAKQPIVSRREFVSKHNICFNCLGGNHTVYNCKKQTTCKLCQRRHHSLLHLEQSEVVKKCPESSADMTTASTSSSSGAMNAVVSCLATDMVPVPKQVLLATALVNAESRSGEVHMVRALLDQGSQACLITESTVQYLRLKKFPIQGIVSGLGNRSTIAKYMVNLTISSRLDPEFTLKLNAYVLSKITSYLPERSISDSVFEWIDLKPQDLADPQFNQPNKIDILLGAEVYSAILKDGMMRNPSSSLIAQSTSLGWVLSGAVSSANIKRTKSTSMNINVLHAKVNDNDILKRFWEIEEQLYSQKLLTPEEQRCEEFYSATTKRQEGGRYEVRLPFREEDPPCRAGNSRGIAESRFRSLEKRLHKNQPLKEQYSKVIKEYLHLNHMKPVEENDKNKHVAVYLPHHAVIREDKTTTKVRVVFNASEKNNKGISLNDTLMIGPTLQADLRHTVLKWRLHPIGLVADIEKMYRQVRIAPEDTIYQRILWRDNPEEDIQDYELLTLTFGTASAPYQAVRTLHQIAYDEGEKYPLVADIVLNCFYMDDLMTGCSTVEEGINIYNDTTELLGKGGFSLQKWNSNNQELLDNIRSVKDSCTEQKENENGATLKEDSDSKGIDVKIDSTMKILGLTWNRKDDCFQYSLNLQPLSAAPVTKRVIISDIARLFDPLGWLTPSVVMAKMFIQKLWLAGVTWDEELPIELIREWITYREELPSLSEVRIPRWLNSNRGDDIELHGFCDASKSAYAAVVYLRRIDDAGTISTSLIAAKSRVAPIKQISIPRLELCGAVLLSRLLLEVGTVLQIPNEKIKAWTDSTVVLAWISSHPSRWKTFVANRTSEILTSMESNQWFHVSTKENPADYASRGVTPSLLTQTTSWFSGPQFLVQPKIIYKRPKDLQINVEQSVKAHVAVLPDTFDIFERFSSLRRLLRVIAYCRRFKPRTTKCTYLQSSELKEALECCIKITQRQTFPTEFSQLRDYGCLKIKSSKLKSLCPYLDNIGIMRVQGRLDRSNFDEHMKHPIVLPASAHLTQLLVSDAHHKTLHGGPQSIINYLRTGYWILGVRNLAKQWVRRCVICARQRANVSSQLMGSLPSIRCTPARPFLHSGVDYAGPISIRTTKGRGHHAYKGYICVFVCMSTRALHLEVVSDMSSQAFLAAFRRFVSRRGHCAKMWSDNGTTFVGAARELQKLTKIQSSIAEQLEANGTEWHFIPPHAPNFGGLWEAAVKSTKFHLKRVIGESTLTFEELSTFLNQVEACLNSRPISLINLDDPGEPKPLTPGHFLIGEPIVSVPDYDYNSTSVGRLSRWQFAQRMLQSFWGRWSQEYLANLMNRYKWSSKTPEPKLGDVVLVKEDDLPPSRWLLGRILDKHPGNDGLTRVVTLRTRSSTIKRPINKLIILPIEQ